MLTKEQCLLGATGLLLCAAGIQLLTKRSRRYKTRPINRNRRTKGAFQYFLSMKEKDAEQFFKITRMTVPLFEELLTEMTPRIKKRNISDGISAEQRLAVTLHYLSQGGSLQNLAWSYHMGLTTVHQIVQETCSGLWDLLSSKYLKSPSSEREWKQIADGFFNIWNFPNCIGALDGKHINIQAPPKSGSLFFNYKKTFSIVLLAACDSNYLFTLVDIGAYGSQSDGGIFKLSAFGRNFENNTMNIPPPSCIPGTNISLPYAMVADEAFPLKSYIMRPFPGKNLTVQKRIFNYRLSRARRCIENTFGILVARWRVLKQTIFADVENVDNIVKACVVLHNFCKLSGVGKSPSNYCPPGFTDSNDDENGRWREELDGMPLQSVGKLSSNNAAKISNEIRENLAKYFISPVGELPWQLDIVNKGQCHLEVL